MNDSYTVTIEVKDVYGTPNPPIPEGYARGEFRPVKQDDTYLDIDGEALVACVYHAAYSPYIILEPTPKPDIYQIEVPAGSQTPIVLLPNQPWKTKNDGTMELYSGTPITPKKIN